MQERARGPLSPYQVWWGLGFNPAPGAAKNVAFFVCLPVSLSVTLLNVRDCAHDFAMKELEYRNILTPLDREMSVVVHPYSIFSDCRQLATPQNAEVQKTTKIVFFPPEGET